MPHIDLADVIVILAASVAALFALRRLRLSPVLGYLAAGVANLAFTLSPRLVVMGGGVMERPSLLPHVRAGVRELLGGYVLAPELSHAMDEYIVAPALGARSGVLGAIALARTAV